MPTFSTRRSHYCYQSQGIHLPIVHTIGDFEFHDYYCRLINGRGQGHSFPSPPLAIGLTTTPANFPVYRDREITNGIPNILILDRWIESVDASEFAALVETIETFGWLKEIQLGFTVTGDFSVFLEALKKCNKLETISMRGTNWANSKENLASFANALSQFNYLETLQIVRHESDEIKDAPAWEIAMPAVQNPNNVLKSVVIGDQDLCCGLHDAEGIHSFILSCAKLGSLAFTIGQYNSFLGHSKGFDGHSNRLCLGANNLKSIEQLMQQTVTLQSLYVEFSSKLKSMVSSLAEPLATNGSLQSLRIHVNGTSPTDFTPELEKKHHHDIEAFHQVLRLHNFTLTELEVDHWKIGNYLGRGFSESFDAWNYATNRPGDNGVPKTDDYLVQLAGISFFLCLNHLGRAKLLGPNATPTTEDWIQAIARWNLKDNLSGVFYYLRMNPGLCNPKHGL